MRIFVSGSLAYDRIMDFPGRFVDHILPEKIHILNVCFMVNGLTERFGGTAGNIAYNLALLGEKPIIVATAGKISGLTGSGWRAWVYRSRASRRFSPSSRPGLTSPRIWPITRSPGSIPGP